MKWLPKMCTVESYIAACLELLEKWHWLTAERATHILKAGMLDKPPICHILSAVSDLDWEEMNQVPYGLSKVGLNLLMFLSSFRNKPVFALLDILNLFLDFRNATNF